ncbi:MAG TPA: alpha-1,2-fucosyltransferase [Mucilaginibacter sp.]|jgi:hypothetical protein|nr:alpha-1,2-fucosyltransferase [Mucilaginibacter sp.]
MIAVRLEGRLGNQLFQYAFAYATAKKLNTSFYLDKSVDNFLLPKYFEVKQDFAAALDQNVFAIRGFKNFFQVYLRKGFYGVLKAVCFGNKTTKVGNEDAPAVALQELKNNRFYIGYFQSVSYFVDFSEDIRNLFQVRPNFAGAFKNVWQEMQKDKKKAVVHIRRGDYVDLNMSLPASYYRAAIAALGTEGIQYIFISDDPDFVRKEFEYVENAYISTHSEIIDLQLLAHADFCILSNSSFSWWGAWLNNNPQKKIFAPKYWVGFKEKREFPVGIGDTLDINWITV